MGRNFLVAFGFLLSFTCFSAQAKTGTVQGYLMNPQGQVDGLLLTNGAQIAFPPHMSQKLTDIIAPKDKIEFTGVQESPKVFRARTITNLKKTTTVMEVPPPVDDKSAPVLTEMKAQGKIQRQIFGLQDKIIGVVLSDGTVVHVSSETLETSKVKLNVGKKLIVTGTGTKNAFGQSIQATELSNK